MLKNQPLIRITMLKYQNKPLDKNLNRIDICGYEFLYSDSPLNALNYLEGIDCICMASCFNYTPEGRSMANYTHIGYYKNLKDFFISDDWVGIHSFYFYPTDDENKANGIIQEIKLKNPDSLFNK